MKNLLILSAIALSFSASASDLISLTSGSGFGPRVRSTKLSVSEAGSIVRVVNTKGEVTKETLGKLSATAVQNLKDKIEAIDDNAKLVDPNPKAPRCMDAPTTRIQVNKGGKEIVIFQRALCHNSSVEDYNAENLTELMKGLNSL